MLPPPPLAGEPAPIPVRYEKTSALFFKSSGDDGAIGRVFSDGGATVLATVVQPETGLFASGDGGASWTFAAGGFDFREVWFGRGRIVARGSTRVFHSEDGGLTWGWVDVVRSGDSIDAMAAGPDGALYVAGRSQLYSSADGGRTWRPISIQLPPGSAWRARSIVPDPAHPHIVYVSIRSDAPAGDLLTRFRALLDFSSDEAVAALKLVDSHDPAPAAVSWGKGVDGVYVTQDGGSLWRKTGLAVDAWLAFDQGALWAAAADPILEAAAMVRRYPDLAGAADRQMKGGGVSPAVLREACRFPGRDALLKGPLAAALAWRSTDSGATWSKLDDVPLPAALALRPTVRDSGTQFSSPTPAPSQPPSTGQRGAPYREIRTVSPIFQQTRYRGVPRHPPGEQGQQLAQRALSPELLLAFVDPMRLVARFNGGLPVSGVADGVAYAATQPYWDALVKALADESQDEHEISLGPGRPAWTGGPAYELLHREGETWTPVPGEPPPTFPRSIAPGIFIVGSNGRAWAIRRK